MADAASAPPPPGPPSAPDPPPDLPPPRAFLVQRIAFGGREGVPILLQNENGPCPALALANTLFLRGSLELGAGATEVEQVCACVCVCRRGWDGMMRGEGTCLVSRLGRGPARQGRGFPSTTRKNKRARSPPFSNLVAVATLSLFTGPPHPTPGRPHPGSGLPPGRRRHGRGRGRGRQP